MSTEILLAVITAIGSLILGIVNSFVGYYKVIKPIKTQKRLEYEIGREIQRDNLSDEYFKKSSDALRTAITQIQELKDVLQLIIDNTDNSLLYHTITTELARLREQIFKTYEESLPDLSKEDSKYFHNAKNNVHRLEQFIHSLNTVSDLDSDVINKLLEFRNRFSEDQNRLRDSLISKISRRI